jgi:hypothetical protein
MKNIILCSVMAIAAVTSLSANAALPVVCAGGAAGAGESFASGGTFVKVEFTPKCSANVFLEGTEVDSTTFTVGSASSKGSKVFSGSTAGGAVCATAPCAASTCDGADATTGTTNAANNQIPCL